MKKIYREIEEVIKKTNDSYQLILCYGNNTKYLIKEIYKMDQIIDIEGNILKYDDMIEYSIFLLEGNYRVIFKSTTNPNNVIIVPLCNMENIFNAKKVITSDIIWFYLLQKNLFDEKKHLLEIFDANIYPLESINAEYICDGILNSNNYSIIPIRLGKEKLLTETLASLPRKVLKKI